MNHLAYEEDEVEVEEDDADEHSEEARGEIFAATGEATGL